MSDDSTYLLALQQIAAGHGQPRDIARAAIGSNQLTVAKMLDQDPFAIAPVFADITTDMVDKWDIQREALLGTAKPKDMAFWAATTKAAVNQGWFASPSEWKEGHVSKFPPGHTRWLAELIWLHYIEMVAVPLDFT